VTDRFDSTLFAAVHGELVRPSSSAASGAASGGTLADAYSLFVARSSAMGWLTEAREGASGGFWGMNDAGFVEPPGPGPAQVAWFQVSLTGPAPAVGPLPVQPFLACVGDVLARIGTVRTTAVQLLLPAHTRHPAPGARALPALLQDAGWFADCRSARPAPVLVTLDGGQDPTARAAAAEILTWLRTLRQNVFTPDDVPPADTGCVHLPSPVIDQLWVGPPRHRATFRGPLCEWSWAAVGWLAALLAEAAVAHGVRTPVLLTVARAEGDSGALDAAG
jgi:hypothetical protein